MTVKLRAFHEPCHLARIVYGQCDGCGEWPEQLHLPTKEHGWYCAGCCPVCQQQRAVKAALAHPAGAGKSDSAIAKHVGVDHQTVANWREKMTVSCEVRKIESRTVTRGDFTYQQNTANIGRGPTDVRELEPE